MQYFQVKENPQYITKSNTKATTQTSEWISVDIVGKENGPVNLPQPMSKPENQMIGRVWILQRNS